MHESDKWKWSHSVVSDPQRPHGLQPTRLLCPWDFPGKSTGVGYHCKMRLHYDLEIRLLPWIIWVGACVIIRVPVSGRQEANLCSYKLVWKIPWTEEPGRLQSMGSWRVGHDWVTSLSLFTFMHWRRNWQPTPVFLPGESQGRQSLVGCRLWGHTESDTTEAT